MNILLISKDSDLIDSAGRALKAQGHRVKVRQDLASARELLSERRPSLVLLDLDLGRDSSSALLLQMKTSMRHHDVPVVVSSALLRAGTTFVQRCLAELGAACFMERPVPDGDWPLVLERVHDGELFGEEIRSVSRSATRRPGGPSARQQATRRLLRGRVGDGSTRRHTPSEPHDDDASIWSVSRVSTHDGDRNGRHASASQPSSRTATRARRVSVENSERLLLRLRRELTILGTVPDRSALAMPMDASADEARRYARRMKRRYLRYADPMDQPPDVVAVVQDILSRLDQAVTRLTRDLASTSGSPESLVSSLTNRQSYDDLMALGRTALSSGRHARAIACFRGARAERPGEAESLAWLGWAIASDSRRPQQERLQEALEYLQLADSFDATLVEGQLFLARLELENEQRQLASARLRRLLKAHPDHTQARKLLSRVDG